MMETGPLEDIAHGNRNKTFSKFLIFSPLNSIPSALSIFIFLFIEIPDVLP
jgi:hypothetical protein